MEFCASVLIYLITGLTNYYVNIYMTGSFGIGGLTVFLHSTIFGYSLFSYTAPFIAVLPAGLHYYESYSNGYIKQELLRISQSKYQFAKMVYAILMGAFVYIFCGLLFMAICFFIDPTPAIRIFPMHSVSSFKNVYASSLLGYSFLVVINSAIFGATYSIMSIGISSLCRSKFLSLAIPTAFYIGSVFLSGFNLFDIPILPCGTYVMLVSEFATIKDHLLVFAIGLFSFRYGFKKQNVI